MPSTRASPKQTSRGRTPAGDSSILRRALGFALLALVLLPWYRLVGLSGSGPAVDQTLRLGALYLGNIWIAALLTLAASVALSFLIPARGVRAIGERAQHALLGLGSSSFALVLAAAATAISTWVALGVLDGKPALLDGVAQLVQARYLASGSLAGPGLPDAEFWQFQFMVLTEQGWVSQYPPGYAVLLAAGLELGVVWLVGPLLLGLAIYLTSLVAERLLPDDRLVARLGALLAAISPVLVFHAASYMSHVLALALTVLAIYASLRAMGGSWMWSLLCGAALGELFATRPYTAIVMGSIATVVVWLLVPAPGPPTQPEKSRPAPRTWARRLAGVLTGSAPFVVSTLLYNRLFFGAATRFGYEAAEGPGHRLGFHLDPWGNQYGPLEALGYTSSDLQGLSLDLLQAPLPVVVLVALYFLLIPQVRGARVAAAWALLPVAAYSLYWHHDLFMGPRLLYEALPGWTLLAAAAAIGLLRALPAEGRRFGVSRAGLGSALAIPLIVAVVYAAPHKLSTYAREAESAGMSISAPVVERASIVFVHGGWQDRLAARLAATGMRVDSIRAALTNNSTCAVQLHLDRMELTGSLARSSSGQSPPRSFAPLAFAPAAGSTLRELVMPSGSAVRAAEGEALDPVCEREATSDFQGVLGVPPLIWQGDLPGLGENGALFVRDFGPERNQRLIARFPEREVLALVRREGALTVMSYQQAMDELW